MSSYTKPRNPAKLPTAADDEALKNERLLVGALLLDPSKLTNVGDLRADQYQDEANGLIHAAIVASGGKSVASVLHAQRHGETTALAYVGGAAYLATVTREADENHAIGYIAHFADEIRESALRRRQQRFAASLLEQIQAGLPPEDIAGFIEGFAEQRIGATTKPADIGPPLSLGELKTAHPKLPPPVIHGLLRLGETMNIIAASKVGKSWLTYLIALCVVTGKRLFDTFGTVPGNVLIIDNELHPEVSSFRIPLVMRELGISPEECDGKLFVRNLRGHLLDIHGIARYLRKHVKPGQFSIIVIDAYYRILPEDMDENGNNPTTQIYNQIDNLSRELGCAFILVHHASKGNQSGKAVTDVGAGAGAQSRAADTHLILRPHEEPGVSVLDAALRSWQPVEPICVEYKFPLWRLAEGLDAAALKSDKPKVTINQIADKVFAYLKDNGLQTRTMLKTKLHISGERINEAVEVLLERKEIEEAEMQTKSGKRTGYQVTQTKPSEDKESR